MQTSNYLTCKMCLQDLYHTELDIICSFLSQVLICAGLGLWRNIKTCCYLQANQDNATFHHAVTGIHLQGQAVVSGSFVFAAVVLPVIHVNMVQLQEAHEISGCLWRKRGRGRCHVLMRG